MQERLLLAFLSSRAASLALCALGGYAASWHSRLDFLQDDIVSSVADPVLQQSDCPFLNQRPLVSISKHLQAEIKRHDNALHHFRVARGDGSEVDCEDRLRKRTPSASACNFTRSVHGLRARTVTAWPPQKPLPAWRCADVESRPGRHTQIHLHGPALDA